MGPAVRRLVLLRHGRTAWNLENRAQGHLDVPLDELGHAQARAAGSAMAGLAPSLLWASDLTRARQTAAYVEEATGLVAQLDSRLREFDVGLRSGLTGDEFAEKFPEECAAWRRTGWAAVVPGAESDADVRARMLPVLHELIAATPEGGTSIAVSHGACLRTSVLALLGIDGAAINVFRPLDNCGWVELTQQNDGSLALSAYNCVAKTTPDFTLGEEVG